MNNLPKVVTQCCLEQDLNPRPTDRKPKCLTVAPPRHHLILLVLLVLTTDEIRLWAPSILRTFAWLYS